MNLPQKIVLTVGFLVLLFIVLFPPWVFTYRHPRLAALERPAGYHLILGQHAPQDRAELAKLFSVPYNDADLAIINISIDQTRLTFEIVGAVLLIAVLYFLLRTVRHANGQ